jgi:uncharacterized damage-inducible protein DinB
MTKSNDAPTTADEVRARNAELDAALLALIDRLDPDELHTDPGTGEWTAAENLGHIAEFPRFFARDIDAQLAEEGATVGRTHEHEERLAAIAAAAGRTFDDLRAEIVASFDQLARVLERLDDHHLQRTGSNRKYGPEPLAVFLDRYVLGHKASHVRQLEALLDAL